eukprot:scaffold2584_cov113-Isochrysis_galbana.AAC.4
MASRRRLAQLDVTLPVAAAPPPPQSPRRRRRRPEPAQHAPRQRGAAVHARARAHPVPRRRCGRKWHAKRNVERVLPHSSVRVEADGVERQRGLGVAER